MSISVVQDKEWVAKSDDMVNNIISCFSKLNWWSNLPHDLLLKLSPELFLYQINRYHDGIVLFDRQEYHDKVIQLVNEISFFRYFVVLVSAYDLQSLCQQINEPVLFFTNKNKSEGV